MIPLLKDYVILIRSHHWVKNFLVIAPAFFGGLVFKNYENFITTFLAFISFSFISSVGYIINDILDSEQDKLHPTKSKRPLASGRISTKTALILALTLFLISILLSVKINKTFLITTLLYLCITLLYSLYLKKIFIIDAISIASGFLLRIIAGGVALNIDVSNWLFTTTLLLSLLLAFGKRRVELEFVRNSREFREVLKYYDKNFLDRTIYILATASIIAFSVYSIGHGWKIFITTTPFVIFGTARYIYLVKNSSKGDPTDALLKDRWVSAFVFIWILLFAYTIYLNK